MAYFNIGGGGGGGVGEILVDKSGMKITGLEVTRS